MHFAVQFKALLAAVVVVVAIIGTGGSAVSAPTCPIEYGVRANLKPNKLYLLFPAETIEENVPPSIFPRHGFNPETKWLPLPKFETQGLKNYQGTPEQLRDEVRNIVANIFCEFNVQVIAITAPLSSIYALPAATTGRSNVVGIGLDKAVGRECDGDPLYGQAHTAGGDPGDSKPIDFARVFAGCYAHAPINLQLAGWANSIGGTVAHEAAHNYGLSHEDGFGHAGDLDEFPSHLMRPGTSYSHHDRAAPRHFSNFETSVLARNIGLAMDTMWIWHLSNPNVEVAARLRIELEHTYPGDESPEKDLVLSWAFAGDTSPWVAPVLTALESRMVTVDKMTTTHTRYQIEWSRAQGWSGGAPGQVPQGKSFHVGATLSSSMRGAPNDITITKVVLLDANGAALQRQPPWMGFDTGRFNDKTRDLNIGFVNSLERPMILRDVEVWDLPRVMSIDAMPSGQMFDVFKRRFKPWNQTARQPLAQPTTVQPGAPPLNVPVANRKQGRHISVQRADDLCAESGSHGYGRRCQSGVTADDLFPATTVYMKAKIVDSEGLVSQLFYQIAGRRTRVP